VPHDKDRVPNLPFGDEVAPCSSASTPAGQAVVQAVGRVLEPCLDPSDPDADLDGLSNQELREHVQKLKASTDRRPAVIVRLFKGLGVLEHRGLLASRTLPAAVEVPTTRPWRSAASARRRFLVLLRRVGSAGSPAHAEALAEFLAMDFVASDFVSNFRTIARGIGDGLVDPLTVRAAYRAAKKPGVQKPAALFVSFVVSRSPGFARARAGRR
jgi:hypothetical protein